MPISLYLPAKDRYIVNISAFSASVLTFIFALAYTKENIVFLLWIAIAVIFIEAAFLAWFVIQYLRLHKQSHETSNVHNDDIIVPADESSTTSDDPSALFLLLSSAIKDEELFLNPLLNRHMLVDRFSVSKDKIGKAFASAGTSLPAFINECRLEYSKKLIKNRPELSLTQIATMSGFTTRESFGRSFKRQYSITPSEYKEQLLAKFLQ